MSAIVVEIIIIFLLLIANGLFSLAEMAVVSARKVRLAQRADDGDVSAKIALDLANNPGDFLSFVQVGITLIGILAGAFGGASIARLLSDQFSQIPFITPYAEALGLGLVVIVITYLSLIIGELVPKRLALNNPEQIATAVARPLSVLSRWAAPMVKLLIGALMAPRRDIVWLDLDDTFEKFSWGLWQFEVIDMDGKRVDKVLVTRGEK
jgi:putative hemolysin